MKKCLVFLLLSLLCYSAHAQVQRTRSARLMGSRFDFTMVSETPESAEALIDTAIAEVSRIEHLISDWMPQTQISQVNSNAGIAPVKVDREVLELTKRALLLSELTDGAFDISFAAMDRIWKFDGSMTEMPSAEEISRSVQKVGYRNIVIDEVNSTIYLRLPGMKIGFGALGEGYAADRCREIMISKGVSAGIVNGSGDMNTWGRQPNGEPWVVGISDPVDSDKVLAVVPLEQSAVVTSGSYEKFVRFNGIRYSHIINPKTGYPSTGISSVTVFGSSAESANGVSTSIMVLGKKEGLKLLSRFPEMKCIIVDDSGKITTSGNLSLKKLRRKMR